jgi:hypothetical protein
MDSTKKQTLHMPPPKDDPPPMYTTFTTNSSSTAQYPQETAFATPHNTPKSEAPSTNASPNGSGSQPYFFPEQDTHSPRGEGAKPADLKELRDGPDISYVSAPAWTRFVQIPTQEEQRYDIAGPGQSQEGRSQSVSHVHPERLVCDAVETSRSR